MAKRSGRIAGKGFRVLSVLMRTVVGYRTGVCRFEPSCSVYAQEACEKLPLYIALPKIVWRILRCNPFSSPRYDPPI